MNALCPLLVLLLSLPAAPLPTAPALPPPDILPLGHKSVRHELVLEIPAPISGWRFVAAPVRGFGGMHEIRPGEPFDFSSKYGTRIYALPAQAALPAQSDVGNVRPRSDTFREIRSVPANHPLVRVVTTFRVAAVGGEEIRLERVSEQRFGAGGHLLDDSLRFWLLGIALVGLCGLLVIGTRRKPRPRGF